MKKDIAECHFKVSSSDKNRYVSVEDILQELYPVTRTSLFLRIKKQFFVKSLNIRNIEKSDVILFTASGQKIDNKIDSINRRISKKFK